MAEKTVNVHSISHKMRQKAIWKGIIWGIIRWIFYLSIIYVIVYPILYVLSGSFKSYSDMLNSTVIWIPKNPTFQNYLDAIKKVNYWQAFLNTLKLEIPATLALTASCAVAGYGMGRYKFKGRSILFGLMIFTVVVPTQVITLPKLLLYKDLGINDTIWAIILPALLGIGLKSGIFVYIYTQFFRGIPKELEESAYIDGCGDFKIFLRIMIPNATPAFVTVFLFSLVWHWSEVFETTTFITTKAATTLAVRLSNITGYISTDTVATAQGVDPIAIAPIKYAFIMLVIAPMIILYAFVQKKFVESVERTGIIG
ncbi:MAG: carbohydrate ABC transporter permease [Clostridia bacterium]|nr:carbohydrate ABC transporter permease [Clostridia bacterium]